MGKLRKEELINGYSLNIVSMTTSNWVKRIKIAARLEDERC
jgi:hypothetical protein